MTTANIIMAVCLIILMGVAVMLIVRYMRKATEVERKAANLEAQEKGLQRRHNALDKWNADIKAQAKRQSEWEERRKHIYANFVVLDSDESKPSIKSIQKSLSSKIGYALRHEFPDIRQKHDDDKGGRTIYSVDFYATEYGD